MTYLLKAVSTTGSVGQCLNMSGNVELHISVAHPFPMILCSALSSGLEGISLEILTGNGFLPDNRALSQ